jgi:hypothetical protein
MYSDPDELPMFKPWGKGIKIATGLTPRQELNALDKTFNEMVEVIEYSGLWGPNSNTFLHQLLVNAGFTVSQPPGAVAWDYNGVWKYGGKSFTTYGFPTAAYYDYLSMTLQSDKLQVVGLDANDQLVIRQQGASGSFVWLYRIGSKTYETTTPPDDTGRNWTK